MKPGGKPGGTHSNPMVSRTTGRTTINLLGLDPTPIPSEKRQREENSPGDPSDPPSKRTKHFASNHEDTLQFHNLAWKGRTKHTKSKTFPLKRSDFMTQPFNALAFPRNYSEVKPLSRRETYSGNTRSIRYFLVPEDSEINDFVNTFEEVHPEQVHPETGVFQNFLKNPRYWKWLGVGSPPSLRYTCAPDSLFATIYSTMVYLGLYHGKSDPAVAYLLQGAPVASTEQYNSLSLLNKMTCRLSEEFEGDKTSVEANILELHVEMADFCKYVWIKYPKTSNEHPLYFLKFFARKFECTKPLTGGSPNETLDAQNIRKWTSTGASLFGNEAEIPVASKKGVLEKDNYVQSLLDYVRFFNHACRGGTKGDINSLGGVLRRTADMKKMCKQIILPFLRNHFLQFYAENMEANLFAKIVANETPGIRSQILRFQDSKTDMDALAPYTIPYGNCIQTQNFEEINLPYSRNPQTYQLQMKFQKETFIDSEEKDEEEGEEEEEEEEEEMESEGNESIKMMDLQESLKQGLRLENPRAAPTAKLSLKGRVFNVNLTASFQFPNAEALEKKKKKQKKKEKPMTSEIVMVDMYHLKVSSSSILAYIRNVSTFETFVKKSFLNVSFKEVTFNQPEAPKTTKFFYPAELEEQLYEWFSQKATFEKMRERRLRAKRRNLKAMEQFPQLHRVLGITRSETLFPEPPSSEPEYDFEYHELWTVHHRVSEENLFSIVDPSLGLEGESERQRFPKPAIDRLTKRDIERQLGSYVKLGLTFRWVVGWATKEHYFGPVLDSEGNEYEPIAIVFVNLDENNSTSGHYWTECKLPFDHGYVLPNHEALPPEGPFELFVTEKSSILPDKSARVSDRESFTVNNSQAVDPGIWFTYDDLMNTGPRNWDLGVENDGVPSEYVGGNKEKMTYSVPSGNYNKESYDHSSLFRPLGMDRISGNIIESHYVSLGSATDLSPPAKRNLYRIVNSGKSTEPYLQIHDRTTKLDSITYVRVGASDSKSQI